MKSVIVCAVLALAAVALAPRALAGPRHGKPAAPVEVRLEAVASEGGYQVTLIAVPTRDVAALELRLAGQRAGFAATAAGQRRTLAARIAVAPGSGIDVVGAAVVGAPGAQRSRAALLRLGTAARRVAPREVARELPDGRTVVEVR